ncbi:hypothetical protein GUITHDRAFT_100361 [Guillardia theta CCMP2712]|uniref:DUF1995 domain-containing protein n=1 Tax=Guillardia theta (strain CCMP2712) TaxID=905079 RepID=L1K0Y4_GUITC|nr:hypothetical protein GUITHDRAFT_100361 [Guillardia theta CCMP2712]EKX54115.1 hypothetical protein GUITHDRAFT_100361 [Guillardia theta CCMP2712]|eukprot:XP_005841095.1 hypothetical protein GUITHDRAFT_100361 [Guillardia theta CCMP2712]
MNNEEHQPRRNEIKFDAAARYRKAFPLGVNNVLDQVRESLNLALDDGLFRLRVQLNIHQFDQRLQSFSDGKMPELVAMIGELLVERGMRPSIMFNTIMDASIARTVLPDHLREKVSINVLGLGEFGEEYDAAVLVAPSNEGNENLQRIEAVEKLIYSGPPRGLVSRSARAKYMQRPIILINPVLEAIHSLSTPHSKVPPMFMSDFDVVYFLQLQASMVRVRIGNAGESVFTPCGSLKFFGLFHHVEILQLWIEANDGQERGVSQRRPWRGFRLIWEKPNSLSSQDAALLDDLRDCLHQRWQP